MSKELLEIKELYAKAEDKDILNGLNLKINKGEIHVIMGPNGAGKSTLANVILNNPEYKKISGEILFEGKPVKDEKTFRRHCQIIFQDPYSSLNPKKKIKSIIEEPLIIHKIGKTKLERSKMINEMRTLIGLPPDSLEKFPHQLSGGQRQRVAIASAMILNPEFVICDECVSALDVLIQAQILNLLKTMQKSMNLTYLFISHNLNVVAYMADRIGVMYKGQIIEEKPTDELLSNPEHPYTKTLLQAAGIE